MTRPDRYRRSREVAWVESPDRVVLVNLADLTSEPVRFEGTAASLWDVLDDEWRTADEVSAEAAARYGVDIAVVAPDVALWLTTAAERGLVERSAPTSQTSVSDAGTP